MSPAILLTVTKQWGDTVIHLVNSRNYDLYQTELAAMHHVRKSVFVDELGWQLTVRNGREYDEYDDDRAQYLMGFSTTGEVVMGLRFRPADDKSMLADHFADWLPDDIRPLNDGRTWEVSRGFCRERGVRRHNLRRKAACMIAPLEIALAHGIDRCVGLTDLRMLDFCYGVGWKLKILGEPTPYAEGVGVAYEIDVSEASVADMRRMWGLPDPAWIMVESCDPGTDVHAMAARQLNERPNLEKLQAQPEQDVANTMRRGADAESRSAEYYKDYAGAVR